MKNGLREINRIFVTAAMLAAILCAVPAMAAEGEGDDAKVKPVDRMKRDMSSEQMEQAGDMMTMFNERLKHRFAPVITSVRIGPARVGQPIEVTVKAIYETDEPVDSIVEAAVFYKTENGKRLEGPVALEAAGKNTFKGAIPAQKSAGKLYVVPWVKDSYGNVGLELSCPVTKWPPFEDPCMVPGAVDADPLDDPAALVEDDYDIWDVQVGMDDDYIYLMIDVEGQIAKGTLNPPHINAYLSMFVDTQELYNLNDIMVFMAPDAREKFKDKGNFAAMVFYAPLAASFDPKLKSCVMPRMGGGDTEPKPGDFGGMMDNEHVKCKVDGSNLFTRVDKSVLTDRMGKSLSIMGSLNGFIVNMQMPLPTLREILPITKTTWNPHVVTVK